MRIAITGKDSATEALSQGVSSGVNITTIARNEIHLHNLQEFDAVFDADFDEDPSPIRHYAAQNGPLYFLGSATILPEEVFLEHEIAPSDNFIGFNNLPGLIRRSLLEACDPFGTDRVRAAEIARAMGYDAPEWVGSRVGMVTPRILCMIINEAFYTLQEGTANRRDIDAAMKLGTNYPHGPFEWCDIIGIDKVYRLLESVYADTKEERYKICPLLKTTFLHSRLAGN